MNIEEALFKANYPKGALAPSVNEPIQTIVEGVIKHEAVAVIVNRLKNQVDNSPIDSNLIVTVVRDYYTSQN